MYDSETSSSLKLHSKEGDGEKGHYIELKCTLRVWQVWKENVLYFEDEEGLIARAKAMELALLENVPVRIASQIEGNRCRKSEEHWRVTNIACGAMIVVVHNS